MKNLSSYILQDATTGYYDFIIRNSNKPLAFDAEHFIKRNKVFYKRNLTNKKKQILGDHSNAKK